MFSQAAMSSINARKYALTMKAAKGDPQKPKARCGVEFEVTANMGELIVKRKGERLEYGVDSTLLFISADYTEGLHPDKESGYYVNHDAGFQRWHKHGCSRIEALGYAKQIGVTVEEFKEAFPWMNPNPKEKDPSAKCTHADFEGATKRAEELFKKLGKGWKPRVWENMGWFWEATFKEITISNRNDDKKYDTTLDNILWVEASTPNKALRLLLAEFVRLRDREIQRVDQIMKAIGSK